MRSSGLARSLPWHGAASFATIGQRRAAGLAGTQVNVSAQLPKGNAVGGGSTMRRRRASPWCGAAAGRVGARPRTQSSAFGFSPLESSQRTRSASPSSEAHCNAVRGICSGAGLMCGRSPSCRRTP